MWTLRQDLRGAGWGALVALLAGCNARPPYLLLTVADPTQLADSAVALRVSADASEQTSIVELAARPLPLTFTLILAEPGEHAVTVEAIAADEGVLARGSIRARRNVTLVARHHHEEFRRSGRAAARTRGRRRDTAVGCARRRACGNEVCAGRHAGRRRGVSAADIAREGAL